MVGVQLRGSQVLLAQAVKLYTLLGFLLLLPRKSSAGVPGQTGRIHGD